MDVFSSSDSLIASFFVQAEIGNSPLGLRFFGLRSTVPIAKLQIAVGSTDFVWFDDLMFSGQVAVPEPSALALFGVGALGLAASGRRWRSPRR